MPTIDPSLKYSAEHEWIRSDSPATVGVSEVATDALGEIVFVDLPEVGAQLTAGQVCGEIESTKSVSELFSPVTGTVTEINDAAVNDPSIINHEAYGAGWLFRVEVSAEGPLLTPAEYAAANGVELS